MDLSKWEKIIIKNLANNKTEVCINGILNLDGSIISKVIGNIIFNIY
jgi:hypothetical protein